MHFTNGALEVVFTFVLLVPVAGRTFLTLKALLGGPVWASLLYLSLCAYFAEPAVFDDLQAVRPLCVCSTCARTLRCIVLLEHSRSHVSQSADDDDVDGVFVGSRLSLMKRSLLPSTLPSTVPSCVRERKIELWNPSKLAALSAARSYCRHKSSSTVPQHASSILSGGRFLVSWIVNQYGTRKAQTSTNQTALIRPSDKKWSAGRVWKGWLPLCGGGFATSPPCCSGWHANIRTSSAFGTCVSI